MNNDKKKGSSHSKNLSKNSTIERLLASIFAPRVFENRENNSNCSIPNEYFYIVYRL